MRLRRVDVDAYSNNAVRREDGRFYMAREVDELLAGEQAARDELRKAAERLLTAMMSGVVIRSKLTKEFWDAADNLRVALEKK